jgi:hypothetical protein
MDSPTGMIVVSPKTVTRPEASGIFCSVGSVVADNLIKRGLGVEDLKFYGSVGGSKGSCSGLYYFVIGDYVRSETSQVNFGLAYHLWKLIGVCYTTN